MPDQSQQKEDAIVRASALSNAGRPNGAFTVLVDEVKRLRKQIEKYPYAVGCCSTGKHRCDGHNG